MYTGIIIEGPSNVTYLPGVTPLPIELTCNITGVVSLWSINGTVFTPDRLPPEHRINGFNILVDTPFNNTEYICVSVMGGDQIMSAPAYIIIAGKNAHVSYIQLIAKFGLELQYSFNNEL